MPIHRSLYGRWNVLVLALCALLVPHVAQADGYNDWSGELAGPGELYVVPAVQIAPASPRYAYWQAQFQVGLDEKVDLLFTGASTQESGGWTHDGFYIQPRYALTDSLNVSLGWFVPGDVAFGPLAAMPGVFHTVQWSDGAWQFNWNLVGQVPFVAPGDTEYFAPFVLQRQFTEVFAGYIEFDFYGPVADLSGGSADFLVGTQIDINDENTVNVCALIPIVPDFAPGAVAFGVWYSRGFEIQPLRR